MVLFNLPSAAQTQESESDLPPVVVGSVIEKTVNSGYRVVGTVKPLRSSTIGSPVGGRVESLLVNIGERVQAGQVLANLRTGTLEIELEAAKAELELFEFQLEEVENGSRPEEIAEADANLKGAEAAMEIAANQQRRLEQLAASGAATETDIENARDRANRTRFAHSAAKALYQRIAGGSRSERIAQSRAQVELQTQRVRLIEDRIRLHSIKAPFDGFVSRKNTEVGAWISSGDPVVEIIQLDIVEVEAPVTSEYAVKLNLGETLRVEFPQLPDRLFTGAVDRIVPQADARARTYPIYVRIKNELRGELPLLLSGMLARVDLPAGSARVLPLVPKDALVLSNGQRTVYVVEPDSANAKTGTVRKVSVELGVALDDKIQVTGNLKAGQSVVTVGNERLLNGMRVRMVPQQDE